jgi:hypothetical protein
MHIRTKTDTGRRGEYPKALERTVFKELGNLTPYVRKKGSLPRTILISIFYLLFSIFYLTKKPSLMLFQIEN